MESHFNFTCRLHEYNAYRKTCYNAHIFYIFKKRDCTHFVYTFTTFYVSCSNFNMFFSSYTGSAPLSYVEGRKLFNGTRNTFYLRLYGVKHMVKAREETRCWHMGHSFRLAARVLLYASSYSQDNTCHCLCYTSRGALALSYLDAYELLPQIALGTRVITSGPVVRYCV